MVPEKRIQYGAGGTHKVESTYVYNRYADPHLAAYLKRRKVKVPKRSPSN
jgi:hypothetical protein